MDQKQVDLIRTALEAHIAKNGSQNISSKMLGVSAATLGAIRKNNLEQISDKMLNELAYKLGILRSMERDWVVCRDTSAYRTISYVFADAQENGNAYWLTGDAGCGKTTTARDYVATHSNAYYVQCCTDMKRSHFVSAVASAVGVRPQGHYPYEIWGEVVSALSSMDAEPLIIFDEADKLSDSVFQYFIDLYNKTFGMCGLVWMSTDAIKMRFDRGRKWSKVGYAEIYSRIGQKFNDVPNTSVSDVIKVCQENGLSEERDIEAIVKLTERSHFDMRHVRKEIHKHFKIIDAQNRKNNE